MGNNQIELVPRLSRSKSSQARLRTTSGRRVATGLYVRSFMPALLGALQELTGSNDTSCEITDRRSQINLEEPFPSL